MRDITQCHPKLQKLADELVTACERKGVPIKIGECFRTVAEQDALYAKGRTVPGNIVTRAKGSSYSSMHQWGVAFDFFRNDGKSAYENSDGFFQKVGQIGVALGLEWGGNWVSIKDMPHFQLPDWGSTTTKLKQLYGTPERFKASWQTIPAPEQKEPYGAKMSKLKCIALKDCFVYKKPGGEKVKFSVLDEITQTKCTRGIKGLAKFKKGKKFDRVREYTGSKGNTWYQTAKGWWLPAVRNGEKIVKKV